MRSTVRLGLGTVSAVVLAASTGSVRRSANDQDGATGVAATPQGAQVAVTWTHAPPTAERQTVLVTDAVSVDVLHEVSAAPDATAAQLDLSDGGYLGGHTYLVNIGTTVDQLTQVSDAATFTLPEVVPSAPEEEPRCRIDAKRRALTIRVPQAATEDQGSTNTITARTAAVSKNQRPWKTLQVPGTAAGSASVSVSYDPAPSGGITEFGATYSVVTAAGTSRASSPCAAGLLTPRPKDFAVRSVLHGTTLQVTWAKAKSPTSAVTMKLILAN